MLDWAHKATRGLARRLSWLCIRLMEAATRESERRSHRVFQAIAKPLFLAGLRFAENVLDQSRAERLGYLAIKCFPNEELAYRRLAKLYLTTQRPAAAVEVLLPAPAEVRRRPRVALHLAQAYGALGDFLSAHATLMESAKEHPRSAEVLIELCKLYRNDAQLERAYAFALELDRLGYSAPTLRVAIETRAKNFTQGRQSLLESMQMRGRDLLRAASAVNRWGHCYPDLAREMTGFRSVVQHAVRKNRANLSAAMRLKLAVSCRLVDDATAIYGDAIKHAVPLRRGENAFYQAVKRRTDPIALLVKSAWANETGPSGDFVGLVDGRPVKFASGAHELNRAVEIFIPKIFYMDPQDEKPPWALVRETFCTVAKRLLQRQDIILVPRHQFSWSACRPMLPGRTFSYHTKGDKDGRHLRFQEGALPGYVTFDYAGYAGFASVATDFDQIRRVIADASLEALRENRSALHTNIVASGQSKYAQPDEESDVEGPYVFVALQIVTDTVAELAWMSSIDLLTAVARLYSGTGTAVVVKRHPFCRSMSVQAALAELERSKMIVVSTASIHSLISKAEKVFTVNSGVGLEALVHGRHVVVSGLCEYAYAATDVRNEDELEAVIRCRSAHDERKGMEFLYFYTHRHAFTRHELVRLQERVDEWLDCMPESGM